MPIYAAVVLIGAARFLESSLLIDFSIALLILSIIIDKRNIDNIKPKYSTGYMHKV